MAGEQEQGSNAQGAANQSGQGSGNNSNNNQQQNSAPVSLELDGKAYTPDELKTLIANIRQGERDWKDKAQRANTELAPLKERYNQEQPVEERLKGKDAEIASLKSELATVLLRGAATDAATKAGAIYPDAVVALINVREVNRGADGNPTNLGALIEGVRKSYPAMFQVRNGSADGGAGQGNQNHGGDMNAAIRRMAGRTG